MFPHTRDSDPELVKQYWRMFHHEVVGDGDNFPLDMLPDLEPYTSIVRARQKIQNEFKLFPASEPVRQRRLELAGRHRTAAVEDKPSAPLIHITCDESGKNERYAIVGSVWINEANRYFEIVEKLRAWKRNNDAPKEFHFTKLSKKDVPLALAFIQETIAEADAVSVKAVLLDRTCHPGAQDELFYQLHHELCAVGIQHERDHGRAILPRVLSVLKDKDGCSDKLYLSRLERRLKEALPADFTNLVQVIKVGAIESTVHPLVQVADLLTGSLNRILNHRPEAKKRNHKDDFADGLLRILDLDPEDASAAVDQDFVMIHVFR